MFIRDVIQARAELAMQREAVRILQSIMARLDVVPAPDGSVRCRFEADDAFLDRLGVWGAAEAELEDTDADTDGTDDREADARTLAPLREDLPVIEVTRLPSGPLLAEVGTVARIVEAARAAEAARTGDAEAGDAQDEPAVAEAA